MFLPSRRFGWTDGARITEECLENINEGECGMNVRDRNRLGATRIEGFCVGVNFTTRLNEVLVKWHRPDW